MTATRTLRERRSVLERQWSGWWSVPNPPAPQGVRDEVLASWSRSAGLVDPGREAAPVANADDLTARWTGSRLHRPVTDLADELRTIADDADFIAAVTDESGTILWTCGGRVMRRKAEQVNFAPGGTWSEPAMGTNALSLALATGGPHSVFSAEHLVQALHGWVCYAAPIKDPQGQVVGVLDLSSTWDRSHPLAMSTVRTLVNTIEARLGGPAPGLRITSLGTPAVTRDGRPLPLRPRQIEILTLLALHSDGLTHDQLRFALFGDRPVAATTLKAQVSQLRTALDGALSTRRYQLTEPIGCDAAEVLNLLRAGDVTAAVRRYTGPLLPDSTAPGIEEWRAHLDVAVREAVLGSDQPDHLLRFGEHHPYDLQIHERATHLLTPADPRRALALARQSTALRG